MPTPPRPLPLGPLGIVTTLARTGLLGMGSASALVRSVPAIWRMGMTPAAAYAIGAARYPRRPALTDPTGSWTFSEITRRVEAMAGYLWSRGIRPTDRVAILCRNHLGFVESLAAVTRIGADVVLLNTAFAAPQVASVVERERVAFLVLDDEFLPRADGIEVPKVVPFTGTWDAGRETAGSVPRPPFPGSRYVLLTSGTTRAPRSAGRPTPLTLDPLLGFTARVPLRVGDVTLIASPLYHALGLGQWGLALVMSSTVVLHRRFDAEEVLRSIARRRVRVLVAVPTMLEELAGLTPAVRRRYDASSLEVVISSGSALGGDLATRFMDVYGDVLYNLYGSTEAAFATVATPADSRAAPGTVGRPLRGVSVIVADDSGREAPVGATGRILVGGSLTVAGSPSESSPGGLFATGDLGHFDHIGRLHVDGRVDDMIVSGGENVYPQPVEDVLMTHPDVADAAVIGRPDSRLGQRLVAFVVARPGHAVDVESVRRHVSERLPRYTVPKEVILVDGLPHDTLGKTLHRVLRDGVSPN